MKRTTVVLEDELFQKLKQDALKAGCSFKDHLNQLLKISLIGKRPKPFKLEWITVKGKKGPAVPIEDRDRLFDFMNESDYP